MLGEPPRDVRSRKPFAALNLLGMQLERAFGLVPENPDELLVGFPAGGDLEEPRRRRRDDHAEFLAQFAHGAGVVVLAAVEVARGGRIPRAGVHVLFHGALLEEHLAATIEHQHVDCAMQQAEPVDLAARALANHFVALVDDVENFVLPLGAHAEVEWAVNIRVNSTKFSRETVSARACGEIFNVVKAASSRSPGQSVRSSLSIILRRCEKARLTMRVNEPCSSRGKSGSGRRKSVRQADTTSGAGKKHSGEILNVPAGAKASRTTRG